MYIKDIFSWKIKSTKGSNSMFLSLSLESHSLRKPLSKHKKKFFLIFDQEISFNNIITLTKQYHAFQKSYLTKMHLPNICYLDHDTGEGNQE